MSIVLVGSTSGSITLQEPAVAGSNTINLPAATGTAVLTGVSGTVDINAAGSNIVTLSTNSTERMRITSGGDVGIGTTTITSGGKLDVNGVIYSSNGTAASPGISSRGQTNAGLFFTDDSVASIVCISAGGSERMRVIGQNGNVAIGTTTTYYNASRLTAVTATASNAAGVFATNVSGDVGQAAMFVGKFDNNTTTSQVFVRFLANNASTAMGQINGNGAGSSAFGNWSDIRLKENIEDIPSQLENICSLRPVEFDYKAGGHQIGFIAQEMQQVYPDVVGEDSEGMLTVTGWSKTEARLVKAIQELKGIVDTQATKIAELEAKLEGTA